MTHLSTRDDDDLRIDEIRNYMSQISIPDDKSGKLDQASEQILSFFLQEYNMSTYEIYTCIKSTNFSMAYVNVHKRVRNLHFLNLIREAKFTEEIQKTSLHAAKFYTLTSAGIFYLLGHCIELFQERGLNKVFERYGDDPIFKMFVYPYFNRKTLLDMRGIDSLIGEIAYYLSECCEITSNWKQRLEPELEPETFRRLNHVLSSKARTLAFNITNNINGDINLYNYTILVKDEKFLDLLK